MSILLTGGNGLLGQKLQKHIECFAPPRHILDITDPNLVIPKCSLIIHCAAYTNVVGAELYKDLCYQTNVIGTRNIVKHGIPTLYISTEYVFDGKKGDYKENDYPNPVNFYALTKLLGEYETLRYPRNRVIRCLFKPRPFKHENACSDQFTTGDYVDVIAPEIALAIKKFSVLPPTLHVGTGKKSTFELARQSRNVNPISVDDVRFVKLPKDTSLNCSLWEKLKHEN